MIRIPLNQSVWWNLVRVLNVVQMWSHQKGSWDSSDFFLQEAKWFLFYSCRPMFQSCFLLGYIGGYIQTGSLLHSKPIGTPVFKYRILLIEKFVHDAVPLGFASVGWLPVFCGVTFAIAVPLCGVTSGSVGWERASARIALRDHIKQVNVRQIESWMQNSNAIDRKDRHTFRNA